MLHEAQASPQEYRGLIVRGAGYSDYFCYLGKELKGRNNLSNDAY